jgi:hypothetical protein
MSQHHNSFFSRLCTPLNGTIVKDVANLFEAIIGNFEDVIQGPIV